MIYKKGNLPASPKVMKEAFKTFGTIESPGVKNNPVIIDWAKEVGEKVSNIYKADSIPWCGLWMALIVKRAGYDIVKDPLWALNWNTFGNRVEKQDASYGDILIFVRKGGGHVGLYVGESEKYYHVLGGNQSDSVSITLIDKKRLYGVRRCPWKIGQPTTVVKRYYDSSGNISTNEK